ncbi:unnamed protein product [Caenorhabditis auriculariae]|uniref:Uncharacterized protein n=1 Tax=Caenorhabditis auriculariae TaxID=2777116 RepID=A0A8S1HGB9_9PELO|nr:unnamed protein product [Caenorhabditis auriculariae]
MRSSTSDVPLAECLKVTTTPSSVAKRCGRQIAQYSLTHRRLFHYLPTTYFRAFHAESSMVTTISCMCTPLTAFTVALRQSTVRAVRVWTLEAFDLLPRTHTDFSIAAAAADQVRRTSTLLQKIYAFPAFRNCLRDLWTVTLQQQFCSARSKPLSPYHSTLKLENPS